MLKFSEWMQQFAHKYRNNLKMSCSNVMPDINCTLELIIHYKHRKLNPIELYTVAVVNYMVVYA